MRKTAAMVALGVVAVMLAARHGQGVAPPLRSGKLTAEQQKQITLWRIQQLTAAQAGKVTEALRLARQVESARERWQGKGHWETVDARLVVEDYQRRALLSDADQKSREESIHRYGQGVKLLAKGKAREAEPHLQEALAIRKKVLGEGHPDIAFGYKSVALCLKAQGKAAQALPLFEKALAIRRKVLGEEHPETAHSYNDLALNLSSQGKAVQALPRYVKALAIRKRVLGEEHPDTVTSYNNVAACLSAQGMPGQAFPFFEKALAIHRKVLGGEHPDTATSYNNVAFCLNAQGKSAQALSLYEKALAISRKVLGEEHPDTATSYNNAAACLYAQGKSAQALSLHQKALAIRKRVLGEEHPDTVISYSNTALCLNDQGKAAQALRLLEKVLAISRKVLGEEHPDTALSYNSLAFCLNGQGKAAQALPLHEKALAISRKVLGEEHPDTATNYNNVAACLDAQGKAAQALPLHEKALAISRKVLGEEHPCTANGYNGVAYCLNGQGKHREAIRHWEAALLGFDVGRLLRSSSGFHGTAFGADRLSPREGLALSHARLGEPRLAWEYAEAALGRGLLEDLAPVAPDDRASISEVRRLDERLLGLVGLENPSDDQKTHHAELTRQRRDIMTRLGKQAAARSADRVWSLERIRKQLPADSALLFWITSRDENWACVVRSTGLPRWQRLEGTGAKGTWTAEDQQGPTRLHELLTRPDASPARRERLARSVEKQWLAPVRPHLAASGKQPAIKRLVVVPSGFMAAMPVELLAPDLVVSYAPSGTIFAQLASRHRALSAGSMLALGDPVFSPPLPDRSTPPATGLFVSNVALGSHADRAGVREGDVLLRYDEVSLKTIDDLRAAYKMSPLASLALWRDGKERTLAKASPAGVRLANQSPAGAVAAWRERNAPATRGESYAQLPGTRAEVESLARLAGEDCRTLLGSDASEQKLDALTRDGSLAKFRILHLATHGQVNLHRPEWSSLILSRDRLPSPAENLGRVARGERPFTGELTVGAILSDWRLDADLVVLSACQTGLGQQTAGDGLLGFSQALLQKGARSVVLSRWQVADDATALLMLRFYENLLAPKARKDLKKPMPRAEALAEAKKWLRELPREEAARLKAALGKGKLSGTARGSVVDLDVKGDEAKLPPGERPYAHPYYWAAFVLIGDPD